MDGSANQPGTPVIRIGDWLFEPRGQTLSGASGKVRLEYRAACLLALFARRADEVVTREEIEGALWPGRTLSPNSVAVVIAGLRKALGDDAKRPRYIETVPKRGYRMPASVVAAGKPAAAAGTRSRTVPRLGLALIAVLVAAAAALLATANTVREPPPPTLVVTVNDVRNQTGDAEFDAVATAISEIGAAWLASAGVPVLIRDRWDFDAADPSRGLFEDFGGDAVVYHVSSTLVREGPSVRLVMFSNDPRTDQVLWAWESEVSRDALAGTVEAALQSFLESAGLGPAR
ncbi:transcriptional regulator [Marinicauda algicola]|uniref:Transcriptional regulator n=1 Tax=Marinicauda algicola TaxID=2029849 RepID=A0A4S2H287_9PROT|nr:transcriptional regulator [Marinicauda algicola]TGY89282.1 transcriptional regulator [Marinicauda algicola]